MLELRPDTEVKPKVVDSLWMQSIAFISRHSMCRDGVILFILIFLSRYHVYTYACYLDRRRPEWIYRLLYQMEQ